MCEYIIEALIVRVKLECNIDDCNKCDIIPNDPNCLTNESRKLIEKATGKKWEDI